MYALALIPSSRKPILMTKMRNKDVIRKVQFTTTYKMLIFLLLIQKYLLLYLMFFCKEIELKVKVLSALQCFVKSLSRLNI